MANVYKFVPNNFNISDFLNWQRAGTLDLKPEFQRRSVWKTGAKSYLVDTVVRGLPVPLLFLRERLDLTSGATIREVVDGQQRLRTLIGFIDPTALPDFDAERDSFTISRVHNKDLGGKQFSELPDPAKADILNYSFSVQSLPEKMDDADILEVFARLNSTGQRLTAQELRNAAWFGECKSLMYHLAYDNTERWKRWRVFNGDQMARMAEVEMTSDLVYNMRSGLSGKSKARLDRMYKDLDKEFIGGGVLAARFRKVMDTLDEELGEFLPRSVYSREVHFFTLFVCTYDLMYGLGSTPRSKVLPKALPPAFREGVVETSRRFKEFEVPPIVLDAVARASADYGRRHTRLKYLQGVISGDQ